VENEILNFFENEARGVRTIEMNAELIILNLFK